MHDHLGDGEAQAGTLPAPVRIADGVELVEYARHLFHAHPDPRVLDGDVQGVDLRIASDRDAALGIGELDRIAQEVHQHLLETPGVGSDRGSLRRALDDEMEPLFLC